jgi:hypothetical protein
MDTKNFDPNLINQLVENQDLFLGCVFNERNQNELSNGCFKLNENANSNSLTFPTNLEEQQKNVAEQMEGITDFSLLDLLENEDAEMANLFKTINNECTNEQPQTTRILEHVAIPLNSSDIKISNENNFDFISNIIKKESEEICATTSSLSPSSYQNNLPSANSSSLVKEGSKKNHNINKIGQRKRVKSIETDDNNNRSFSISNDDSIDSSRACSSDQSCNTSEVSFDSMNTSILSRCGRNQNRESNKEAANKYRLKKLSEKNNLFETSQYLEKENEHVKNKIEIVQTEINYLKTFLVQMIIGKNVSS